MREAEREKKSLLRRVKFLDGRLKNLKNCLKGRRKESNETQEGVSFTPRSEKERSWKIAKSRSLRDLESSKANFGSESKNMKFEDMKDNKPKLDEGKLKAVNCIVSPTRIPFKHEPRKKEKTKADRAVPSSPELKSIAIQSTDFQLEEMDIVYSQKLITKWERIKRSNTTEENSSRFNESSTKRKSNFKIYNMSSNAQSHIPSRVHPDSFPRPQRPSHSPFNHQTSQFHPKKNCRRHKPVRNISHFSTGKRGQQRSRGYWMDEDLHEKDYQNFDQNSLLLEEQDSSPPRIRYHSALPSRKKKLLLRNSNKNRRRKINFSYKRKNNSVYSPIKNTQNIRFRKSKRRNLRTKSSIKPSIYYN